MAREILFKAKRIDNGEWVEGSYIKSRPINEFARMEASILHYDDEGRGHLLDVHESTICQYTGLTDKNGNKIWENDILEWEYNNVPSDYYECVWLEDECAFAFRHFIHKEHYENPVDCHDECYTGCFSMKVIGNIFDDPELLKGE